MLVSEVGRAGAEMSSNKQHLSAYLGHLEQLGDMFIIQPDTAVGGFSPDFARIMGPVDAVILPREVQCV